VIIPLHITFNAAAILSCTYAAAAAGIRPVTFADWQKIDKVERSRGESRGKLREKIVDVTEMLQVAHS